MKNISEVNLKNYREFYSMQELVSAITKLTIVWSWAARKWENIQGKMLRFRVSAHRHKGRVYIAVNGMDLFDIWLTKLDGTIVHTFTDVYIEDLISTIDTYIEKQPNYTF